MEEDLKNLYTQQIDTLYKAIGLLRNSVQTQYKNCKDDIIQEQIDNLVVGISRIEAKKRKLK